MMVPCPVGTYRTTSGGTSTADCVPTPAGYFTSKSGSAYYTVNLCDYGHFCPARSHQSLMYHCPKGMYQDLIDQTSCKTCIQGYYCNEVQILPILCPQGSYCPAGTSTPSKCQRGTYGASMGIYDITQCSKCSPGAFCTQVGLTSPDGLCDPGFYCKEGATVPNPTDDTTGNVCLVGGFCEYGSKLAQSCPPGTYNPNTKGKTQ